MNCKAGWKYVCLAVSIGSVLVFGGCQGAMPAKNQAIEETGEISVAAIISAIQDHGPLEQMVADNDSATQYFGVDETLLQDFAAWLPAKNIQANQMFIGEVNSQADATVLVEILRTHQDEVAEVFSTYLPEQEKLAKDGFVEQKGNFVFLVIDEEADQLLEIFTQQFR